MFVSVLDTEIWVSPVYCAVSHDLNLTQIYVGIDFLRVWLLKWWCLKRENHGDVFLNLRRKPLFPTAKLEAFSIVICLSYRYYKPMFDFKMRDEERSLSQGR